MKANKLGTYLTSFTNKDWAQYHKFSKSQYLENSDYQLIIGYIKKHRSRYEPSNMDNEFLRKKIKPSASKQEFANIITNLCKFIEKYLVWSEVENDPMMEDTLLLQALGKRGLSIQFHKQKEKSKKKRKTLPIGLWNHYHNFMAEYLLYYCNMTSDIETSKIGLEQAFASLSDFIETINGYLGVEMHNRTTLLNENWTETFHKLGIENIKDLVIRNIYTNLMILKETKDQTSFHFLNKELHKNHLSNDLRYTILIHLTSFINGQIVRGKTSDTAEILELYQYGLVNNLLFPSGLIPLLRFINIINIACDSKNYEWAENFINKYSIMVDPNNEKEVKLLGLSQIEFSKNNFENVLEILRDVRYKIFDIEARAKWFLLCSFYELNKANPLIIEYNVNSFINFLKRNKLKTTKLTSASFIKSANYILRIAKNKKSNKILEGLKAEKSLYYRKWLIQKAKEH